MLKSFADKETRKIWNEERSRRFPPDIQQRAMISQAIDINDLRIPPALRLSRYFGTSAEFWIGLQNEYDLRKTRAESGEIISSEVHPLAEHQKMPESKIPKAVRKPSGKTRKHAAAP